MENAMKPTVVIVSISPQVTHTVEISSSAAAISPEEKIQVINKVAECLGVHCSIREKLLYKLCRHIAAENHPLFLDSLAKIPGLESWWEKNREDNAT